MKLEEISKKIVEDWLKRYTTQPHTDVLIDSIQSVNGRYYIEVDNLSLRGKNKLFVKPPIDITVTNTLRLFDYDFDKSEYSGINTQHLLLNGSMITDIEKVIKKALHDVPNLIEFRVITASKNIHNLIDAVNFAEDRFSMGCEISILDGNRSIMICSLEKYVFIENKRIYYDDVFDLQDILINRGYEAIV